AAFEEWPRSIERTAASLSQKTEAGPKTRRPCATANNSATKMSGARTSMGARHTAVESPVRHTAATPDVDASVHTVASGCWLQRARSSRATEQAKSNFVRQRTSFRTVLGR